jgi:HopA1 effector protein family
VLQSALARPSNEHPLGGDRMGPAFSQNRSFEQRLADFGPELGAFLKKVWSSRSAINLQRHDVGSGAIYGMYSGTTPDRSYNAVKLLTFVDRLKAVAGNYNISCQALGRTLGDLHKSEISIYGPTLWTDFFHVFSPSRMVAVRNRLYVHATNGPAGLEIMRVIIGKYGSNRGISEAKICGPGSRRLDTIVAYLGDDGSRNTLMSDLMIAAKSRPGLFADSLPPLIKRVAPGIGTSNEPPEIEIEKGKTRHSFGSFYSSLIWVALKETPQVATPNADPRHMLDNMLYSLKLLRVDPRNPTCFPDAAALEQWSEAKMLGR